MKSVKIGLAQSRQTSEVRTNEQTIFRFLDEAAAGGVRILCFPEGQTVGYRVDITPPNAPVPAEQLEDIHRRIADRCGQLGIACILGTETPCSSGSGGGKPYNSALVISETGKMLGTHHKTKLTPLDALAYTPGEHFETFDLAGVTIGVVICFEGFRFPESTRQCVGQGAQIVFHPQNNTTRPNDWKIPIHHAMIVTRAAENTIWLASCNACLEHQNCRSMIVAPDGQVHAQTELKREQLLTAEVDIDRATLAMFNFDVEACAELLFADTVKRAEFKLVLPEAPRRPGFRASHGT